KTFRKRQQFLNAGHVLNREDRPASTFFGTHRPRADNQCCHGDLFAVSLTFDLSETNGFPFGKARCVAFQRMAGNVKAEHRVFAGEPLFFAPGSSVSQFEWSRRRSRSASK